MARVTTQFVSDDANMQASIQKMTDQMAKLQAQAAKANEATKQSAKDGNDAMTTLVRGAGQAVAAFATVGTAVGMVRKELEAVIALQNKAAGKQLGAAGGERDFLFNAGFRSQSEQQKLLANLAGVSKRTGVALTDLYTPGGSALSASGGSDARAFEALEEAAKLAPHNAQQIELFAGAFQDLARASDSGKVKDSVALLAALSQAARVTNPAMVASNLGPAFIGVKQRGGTDAEAGGLIASMTLGTADFTGASSKTASIQLAKQLADFLPEQDRFAFGAGGKKTLAAAGTGLTSTDARIKALQGDPALRERFLAQASFEASSDAASRALFDPKSGMAKQYEISKQQFATAKQAGEKTQLADVLGQTPLQQTADMDRRFNRGIEDSLLNATQSGRYAVIRNRLDEAAASSGFGYAARQLRGMDNLFRGLTQDPIEMGINSIEAARKSRRSLYGQHGRLNEQELDAAVNNSMKPMLEMLDVLKKIESNQKAANPNGNVEGQ